MGTTHTQMTGDNLDRLMGLLEQARAEEAARPRVDLETAVRMLLAAIDANEPAPLAA